MPVAVTPGPNATPSRSNHSGLGADTSILGLSLAVTSQSVPWPAASGSIRFDKAGLTKIIGKYATELAQHHKKAAQG